MISRRCLLNRITDVIKREVRNYIYRSPAKEFIAHNKRIWRTYKIRHKNSVILVDAYYVPDWTVAVSYFANILSKKHCANLCTFHYSKYYWISSRLELKIRASFNCKNNMTITLNRRQKSEARFLVEMTRGLLKNTSDLRNLELLGYDIGIDIYESYLRGGRPTLDLADENFWRVVERSISYLIFWRDYLKKNRVAAIILSHDCYSELNSLAKVAYKNGVPVYLPNPRGMWLSTRQFSIYRSRFKSYPHTFKQFNQDRQDRSRAWAKQRLSRRLVGEVGVDMPYSKASAFGQIPITGRLLTPSDRIKVVIYTHCFFDNPHAYGDLIFNDFFEWLEFLGEMSTCTNYDWYMKPHPDYMPGTIEILESIVKKYDRITLLPSDASNYQLVKEGVSFALTCYGSIGHELPLLGVTVVNAGNNPHVAYNFNVSPKSISDYEKIIRNLEDYKIVRPDLEKIYEFYYMHYNHEYLDSLIFDSHRKMLESSTQEISEHDGKYPYRYFLDSFTNERHDKIIRNIENFIESGKQSFSIDDLIME